MPAAARGPIAVLAHQARYEMLTAARNPRARFFTFFFPVVMLVIFAGVFHGTTTVDGVQVKLSRYFTFGILTMSIVLACYANLVVAIATMRESGVLKRRRATPLHLRGEPARAGRLGRRRGGIRRLALQLAP